MNNPDNKTSNALRNKAEALLDKSSEDFSSTPTQDVKDLLHELNVHQVELEMQNDELRRAQSEVEHMRDKYSDLYDFAPVGYIVLSEKDIIVEANLTICTMLGIERSFLLKKRFPQFISRECQDDFYLFWNKILKIKNKQTIDLKLRKDGSIFDANLECVLQQDAEGKIIGIRAAVTDITKRKKAEYDLKKYREHLEELVKERTQQLVQAERLAATGRLAASFAHEINSPLQGMVSHLELMNEVFPENSKRITSYNSVVANTKKLIGIVKKLLDIHRKKDMKKSKVKINDLIEKVGDLIDNQLKMKNISLDLTIDEQLSEVSGDEQQLHQVVLNILLNAVDSIESGGKIGINVSCDKAQVSIQIKDNGKGIKSEDINHVFDPFFSTKKDVGVGLGLFVCKGLIDNHNGALTVESQEGAGSVFTITLPRN